MIVVLALDAADVTEPDDCTRLHVSTGLAPADVDAARPTGGAVHAHVGPPPS